MPYRLQCLLCSATPESLDQQGFDAPRSRGLFLMQEHVMEHHGFGVEDLRGQTRRESEDGECIIFTMPGGVEWLRAEYVHNEHLAGV